MRGWRRQGSEFQGPSRDLIKKSSTFQGPQLISRTFHDD